MDRGHEEYLRQLRNTFKQFVQQSAIYSDVISAGGFRDLDVITCSLFFSLVPLHLTDKRVELYLEKARSLLFDGTNEDFF